MKGTENSRKGQSLVEFALIFPIFIMLVFGIIDFARGFYQYSILNEACRKAVRKAVVMKYNPSNMRTQINSTVSDVFDNYRFSGDSLSDIDITIPSSSQLDTEPILVRAQSEFNSIIANLIPGLTNPLTIFIASS